MKKERSFFEGEGWFGMEKNMQGNRSHPLIAAILWTCFLALVAVAVYLSFQDGEEAKALGRQFIQFLAGRKYQETEAVSQTQMVDLTYEVRQTGRAALFFLLGIFGTVAMHVSFKRCNWVIKTGVTAAVLVAIAFLTEKLKIYIPSRHYDYDEMMISIISVIAGFAIVSVVTLLFYVLKGIFQMLATAIHS